MSFSFLSGGFPPSPAYEAIFRASTVRLGTV